MFSTFLASRRQECPGGPAILPWVSQQGYWYGRLQLIDLAVDWCVQLALGSSCPPRRDMLKFRSETIDGKHFGKK